MTDVSHHHLATQQIRDSEERMRKFAAITTEAIVLHRDGFIMNGNDALSRLVGYSLDEPARNAGARLRGARGASAGAAEHAQRA